MTSVRELLVREVERLSEEDAREVLDLLKRKQATGLGLQMPNPTREDLIEQLAGRPGIHVPDAEAPPFEKLERIATRGIPASELLIAERSGQLVHDTTGAASPPRHPSARFPIGIRGDLRTR